MKKETCKICLHPESTRIDGWILAGIGANKILKWCKELEPPLEIGDPTLDDHIDTHINLDDAKIQAMLIKWNTTAQDIIDEARESQNGLNSRALGQALNIRMRNIEILAKVQGSLADKSAPKSVTQNLTVMLPKETQRAMLETAIRKLDPPNLNTVNDVKVKDADTPDEGSNPQGLPSTEDNV